MWVLLVIAGVIGSCSAEVVLPVLPGLLPTLALGHKHVHGHGRQLQVSSTPEGCSNATVTAWATCQKNAPAPNTDDVCTNLKAFEAGFTCDVNNIFDCANLKAVNDELYSDAPGGFNLCGSDRKVEFASAPNLCPGVTFPNMAKVMAKACPVLTTAEQCSVSLNGCLSASERELIAKGNSLDECTASTVLEKFFKCTSAAPSCAAASSATCSRLTSSVLSAAEKKCALTMTNVRNSCNLKSDAGGVASLAASVVLAAAAVVVVA